MNREILHGFSKIDHEGDLLKESSTVFSPGVYEPDENIVSTILSDKEFHENIRLLEQIRDGRIPEEILDDVMSRLSQIGQQIKNRVVEKCGYEPRREDYSAAIFVYRNTKKG